MFLYNQQVIKYTRTLVFLTYSFLSYKFNDVPQCITGDKDLNGNP